MNDTQRYEITLTLDERHEILALSEDLHCVFIDADDEDALDAFCTDASDIAYTLQDCDVEALRGTLEVLSRKQLLVSASTAMLITKLYHFACDHSRSRCAFKTTRER